MNDAALLVHVVEAEEHLFCDLLDDVRRHAAMLVSLDEAEQVLAEHLKDHANVRAVGALVSEMVEEGDAVAPARVTWVGRDEALEQLDLVECSFAV